MADFNPEIQRFSNQRRFGPRKHGRNRKTEGIRSDSAARVHVCTLVLKVYPYTAKEDIGSIWRVPTAEWLLLGLGSRMGKNFPNTFFMSLLQGDRSSGFQKVIDSSRDFERYTCILHVSSFFPTRQILCPMWHFKS